MDVGVRCVVNAFQLFVQGGQVVPCRTLARTNRAKNLESVQQIHESFIDSLTKAILPPSLPPIIDFAEKFCHKILYPRQKTLLRLIYLEDENFTEYDQQIIGEWIENFQQGNERIGLPPDVLERLEICKQEKRPHFREIEYIGGRRGGKGHLGGVIGAYECWRLLTYDSPQWKYGIDPNVDLYLEVIATSLDQAIKYQFSAIRETITGAECFDPYLFYVKNDKLALRTPADIRRAAEMERRNLPVEKPIASIRAQALSSNSSAGRGAAAFAVYFDEFAHMLNVETASSRTSGEVYKAIIPSLGQVKEDGLIYIPTSPYMMTGQAYKVYQQGFEQEDVHDSLTGVVTGKRPVHPTTLVMQLPSWGPYEDWNDPWALQIQKCKPFRSAIEEFNEDMRREERANPDAFKVERRAQWAETQHAYLNPLVVNQIFMPYHIQTGAPIASTEGYEPDALVTLGPKLQGIFQWQYRAHADPSKSQHNFCFAIGHTEPFRDAETGEVWDHVIIDLMRVWKPSDYHENNYQIPYDEITKEIASIVLDYRGLRSLTYDQYGGYILAPMMKSLLKQMGGKTSDIRIYERVATATNREQKWERLKTALGMNWVHTYKDNYGLDNSSLLEAELKYLQEINGKVKKQDIGMVTTDDLADAVSVVVSEILADQIDRFYKRKNLSGAHVLGGARGGYTTDMESGPRNTTNLERLRQYRGTKSPIYRGRTLRSR